MYLLWRYLLADFFNKQKNEARRRRTPKIQKTTTTHALLMQNIYTYTFIQCMGKCACVYVAAPQKSSATQTTATTFRIYVLPAASSASLSRWLSVSVPIFVLHFLCSPLRCESYQQHTQHAHTHTLGIHFADMICT